MGYLLFGVENGADKVGITPIVPGLTRGAVEIVEGEHLVTCVTNKTNESPSLNVLIFISYIELAQLAKRQKAHYKFYRQSVGIGFS